jgi:hypothetical protein
MKNTDLSTLDVNQIQRRVYDESKDATRVYLVGGGSKTVNDGDIALEIQDPKMLAIGQATTAQRTAFTALEHKPFN